MSATINTSTLGKLKQSDLFPDWWESGDIAIPFFNNTPLCFCITDYSPGSDQKFMQEADTALANFLALTNDYRLSLSGLVADYCNQCLDVFEDGDKDRPQITLTTDADVWNYVTPKEIYLSRRDRRDKDIYIQVDCDCAWEEEHGLQLVFRQGKKITRISDIDGHLTESDAYDIPDAQDELLSQF